MKSDKSYPAHLLITMEEKARKETEISKDSDLDPDYTRAFCFHTSAAR